MSHPRESGSQVDLCYSALLQEAQEGAQSRDGSFRVCTSGALCVTKYEAMQISRHEISKAIMNASVIVREVFFQKLPNNRQISRHGCTGQSTLTTQKALVFARDSRQRGVVNLWLHRAGDAHNAQKV